MTDVALAQSEHYMVQRWPAMDEGSVSFKVVDRGTGQVVAGFSSDPGTRAFKWARREVARLERDRRAGIIRHWWESQAA